VELVTQRRGQLDDRVAAQVVQPLGELVWFHASPPGRASITVSRREPPRSSSACSGETLIAAVRNDPNDLLRIGGQIVDGRRARASSWREWWPRQEGGGSPCRSRPARDGCSPPLSTGRVGPVRRRPRTSRSRPCSPTSPGS